MTIETELREEQTGYTGHATGRAAWTPAISSAAASLHTPLTNVPAPAAHQPATAEMVAVGAWQRRRAAVRDTRSLSAATLAGLLLCLASAAYVLYAQRTAIVPANVYTTTTVEQRTIETADGSTLELNNDTRVAIRVNAQERTVRLDRGDVFFDLTEKLSRPFVITAGTSRLTAQAAAFGVRRTDEHLEIAAASGVVEVDVGALSRTPIELVPGDVVTLSANGVDIERVSLAEIERRHAWRDGEPTLPDNSLDI